MNRSNFAKAFYWIFGVITCAYYAFETEWVCSQSSYLWALFLPLWLIPISNVTVLLLNSWRTPTPELAYCLRTLNNSALVVSVLLTLVLSPLIFIDSIICGAFVPALIYGFFAFIAKLSEGVTAELQHLGHLTFTPIENFPEAVAFASLCLFLLFVAIGPIITTFAMRQRLRTWSFDKGKSDRLRLSSCLALIIGAIVVCEFPSALTSACSEAISNSISFKQALLLLRAVGDERELLRFCYGERASIPWFFCLGGNTNFDDFDSPRQEQLISREIYYRVTGKPFNSSPRPAPPKQSMPIPLLNHYSTSDDDENTNPRTFYYYPSSDRDFAGATVGGLVRGLSLSKSSITGWVDPNEAVASLTWNMRFHGASKGKELRAQILLPPHAVVTGCTLTVNGVKRNAVIGTRSTSREAYTIAANNGEKPLLVSTAGAGRVLLQSSTGWWSSDADLTVNIATPLIIPENNKAVLALPIFTERNFEVATKHQILLTSSRMATVANKAITVRNQSDKGRTDIEGTISNDELADAAGTIYFQRDPNIPSVVAEDSADPKYDVLQQIQREDFFSSTPLIAVVDGSSTMGDWTGKVSDVLKNIHFKDATIIWASDVPQVVVAKTDTNSPQWSAAIERLRDSSCLGGQDNAEALALALKQADSGHGANVVWIHGPQPVEFFKTHLSLSQLSEKQNRIRLFEYQIMPGPNEVVKSLDQSNALVQVPHLSSLSGDLQELFNRLSGQVASFSISRNYIKHGSLQLPIATHSSEITQLAARDQVFAHLAAPSDHQAFEKLAESYNLVTPLTSAIVLEHDADYDAYGVKRQSAPARSKAAVTQFAAGLIPIKPEPPMFMLVVCALFAVAMMFFLKRRRNLFA
jgi:hypothetical protein